jgi:hypothetical protein
MTFGAGINGLQRVFSSFLLMLMLLVSNAPFMNALASMQADCGTKCCRNKKLCCCRKKVAAAKPAVSISARTCPQGCGQPVGIPSVSLAFTALGLVSTSHILSVAFPVPILVLVLAVASLCFALFQRPPPPHLLSAK